jgi:hypothetical protein
MGVNQLRLELN